MSEASAQDDRAGGEGLDGGEHSSGRAGEAGGQQQQRPPPLSPSCLAPPSPGPAAVLLRRKNPHGPACSRVGDEFQARVPDAPCLSAAAARRGAAAAESARGDVRVNHPGERFALAPRPALRIAEERLFVALMHLFPKNFSYIGRVMGRDVATLLVHYYAVFKRSIDYRRYKGAANFGLMRGRLLRGERWRSIKAKLVGGVADDKTKLATLTSICAKLEDGKMELEDFVPVCLEVVGDRVLSVAFEFDPTASARAMSSLTPAEVLEDMAPLHTLARVADALLVSGLSESTQRVCFLRRVWPALVRRGWSMEHDQEDPSDIFFLRPGVAKGTRDEHIEDEDYFDSIDEVLRHICLSKDPTYQLHEFQAPPQGSFLALEGLGGGGGGSDEGAAPPPPAPPTEGDPVEVVRANRKRFSVGRLHMVRDPLDGRYYQCMLSKVETTTGRLLLKWCGFDQLPQFELYANDGSIAPPLAEKRWKCVDKGLGAWIITGGAKAKAEAPPAQPVWSAPAQQRQGRQRQQPEDGQRRDTSDSLEGAAVPRIEGSAVSRAITAGDAAALLEALLPGNAGDEARNARLETMRQLAAEMGELTEAHLAQGATPTSAGAGKGKRAEREWGTEDSERPAVTRRLQ